MKVTFVGDVHGLFWDFEQIINTSKHPVIQLGDLGLGFRRLVKNKVEKTEFNYDKKEWHFLAGNHDNPSKVRTHPNFLGDFGMFNGMFFVSGAFSIDRQYRTEGLDWWPEEELSIEDGYKVLAEYEKQKPDIVISHECPGRILYSVLPNMIKIKTRTNQLLMAMFSLHQPKHWYFGHYHVSLSLKHNKTEFHCLKELEVKDADV